jgi:hypothetical protein
MGREGLLKLADEIKVVKYSNEEDLVQRYISFLEKHYANDVRLPYLLKNVSRLLSEKNPFFEKNIISSYLVVRGEEILGHCSAVIDLRNGGIGLIGFFDCVEDIEVSNTLLEAAVNFLKENGCKTIRGPINLSIWHDYRFTMPDSRNLTIFDPFCKEYYLKFWKEFGFEEANRYVSAVRKDFSFIIPQTEESYKEHKKEGFIIRPLNKGESDSKLILDLSNRIFRDSWNFVPLTYGELIYLYGGILDKLDSEFLEIVETKTGEPIAFCFSIPNILDKKQLILKTIGVVKEFREQNVAAALLFSQHIKAKEKGFEEVYYSLIHNKNNVMKFPYGGYDIVSEYVVLELPN